MTIKLVIDDEVFRTDLAAYQHYVDWCPGAHYFNGQAGTEPYRLLARLAQQLPPGATVADCGTLYGCSAVALAVNPKVEVITYDIADLGVWGRVWPSNIRLVLRNCLDHVQEMASAALIHLDIDPHDGVQEVKFLKQLVLHDFKGVLVCDDIHLNDDMKRFWVGLTTCWRDRTEREPMFKLVDATRWGHHSGTGVVVFDPETIDVEVAE